MLTLKEVLKKLIPLLKENINKFFTEDIKFTINNILFITKNYSIKNIEFEIEYNEWYKEYYLSCDLHVEGSTPVWLTLSHIINPEYIKQEIHDHRENKPKPKIYFKSYIKNIDIVETKQDLALGLEKFHECVNWNIRETAEEAVLKIRKALMKGLIEAEVHIRKDYKTKEYYSWIGYVDNTRSKKFTYISASELILAVMLKEIYLDGGDKIYE